MSAAAGPAFLAALAARSPDGLRAALSPSFAGKANGRALDRDGMVRLLDSFFTGFSDGAFAVEATGGSGHQVWTWTFTGTHDGVHLGMPPSGTKVTLSGFTIAVWNATGIMSLDWKWDTKAFARQVLGPEDLEGAFPPAPQHRPDPSARWARQEQRIRGQSHKGKGKPKGRKPDQRGRPRQGPPAGGEAVPPDAVQASDGGVPATAPTEPAGAPVETPTDAGTAKDETAGT